MSLFSYIKIEDPEIIQGYKDFIKKKTEWMKVYNDKAKELGFIRAEFHPYAQYTRFSRAFRNSILKQKEVNRIRYKFIRNSCYYYRISEKDSIQEMEDIISKVGLDFDNFELYRILLKSDLKGKTYNLCPLGEIILHEFEGVERLLIIKHSVWGNSEEWFVNSNAEEIKKSEYYRLLGQ
jgi:hypothetical protein